MTTETSLQVLGKPVEVAEIDGALKELWEADEASTNASLMNFLVYTEDPSRLVENSQSVSELTREHACRAVLIAMDRKAQEAKVDAWITAHCHLAHGKKSICSEQIAFLLHGKSLGRLRNTVFAHLNSDLPLVFWWQDELSDLFEERLYRLLNRLLYDSSSWSDPAAGYQMILQAHRDTAGKLITQDLAWTRSYYFRLSLAGLFDDPQAIKALPQVSAVTLKAHRDHRTAALMFVAWIIKRANWTVTKKEADQLILQAPDGHEITLSLSWQDEGPALASLQMTAPGMSLAITREQGSPHLCQALSVEGHNLEHSGPADAETPSGLVASQLSRGGKNSLFRQILPQFLELL